MNTILVRRGRAGSLAAACVAIILAQFANVVPAPINGAIQTSLHADGVGLSWITSAFLLPTSILELSFGVLGDLLGRRRVLLSGSVVVIVGALIAGSAHSVAWLVAGQAVAGVGAGALIPTSLAIAVSSAADGVRRSRNVAVWALAMSIGTVIGIIVSGGLGQAVSWHASFYASAPLAVVCLVVAFMFAEESSAPEGRSLDWGGQAAIAVGLFCLLFGIVQGTASSWSPTVLAVLAVGVAGIVGFVVIERRVTRPMMHLEVFRVPAFSAAAGAVLIGMFSFVGSVYVLSIRVSTLQGHQGISAAAFFVVLQGVPCLIGPVLPRIMRRVGARRLVTGGLALLGVGDFWLAAMPITSTGLSASIGPLLLEGVGFIVVMASMTDAAVSAVPFSQTGMASAAISTVRDFGMCAGPAVVSAVALHAAAVDLPHRLAALSPDAAAAASHAAAAGGPFAVLSVPPAALSGLQSLAHGYALGLVVCGFAAVAAAGISAAWLRQADDRGFVTPGVETLAANA